MMKMGDAIKDALKEDPTKKRVTDSIKENLKAGKGNLPVRSGGSSLQRLHQVASPIQTYEGTSSLAELESAVKDVNDGQRQLEVVRRMERSAVYRGMIRTYDGVLSLFGRKPNRVGDVYELFKYQQGNVRKLNGILAGMTSSSDKDVKQARQGLDNLLVTTSRETVRRQELEQKEIPPEIKRYDTALVVLKEVDKAEDPKRYYGAL